MLHDVAVQARVLDQGQGIADELGVDDLNSGDGRGRVLGRTGAGRRRGGQGKQDCGLDHHGEMTAEDRDSSMYYRIMNSYVQKTSDTKE